nr:ficolin-2 [Crassostrea gigas]
MEKRIVTLLFYFINIPFSYGFADGIVQGQRFVGPVAHVITTVGQQQCEKECLARPNLCKGVNYRRKHLLCEIVSSKEDFESNPEYTRITVNQLTDETNGALGSTVDQKCVKLASKQTFCVKAFHNLAPYLPDGLYRIKLPVIGHVTALCEMTTDGGGWTVFQRRLDGSEDFYRTWDEYKNGFGNLTGEFWFGNEKLHHLLSQGTYELRMDMSDFTGQTRYVKYSHVDVNDETSKYRISIAGYSGNVADCLSSSRGINTLMFTTKDQDNDLRSTGNCAVDYKGGWWYENCHCTNPNGLYLAGNTTLYGEGITYVHWLKDYYSLKTIRLMVRRV